jgi:RimJ/RimL family protein N-acetyltransferase
MSGVHPAAVEIPIITTERLRLRAPTEQLFESYVAMWSDPAVVRFIGGRPFSQEETWARLLKYIGHWALKRFGFWMVEELSTSNLVGEIGFAEHKRKITPSLEGIPEMGWAFAAEYHGRGYASEAMRAALGWADAHLHAAETACIINQENVRSVRLAEANGFVRAGDTVYKDKPIEMFRRNKAR